MALVAGSIVAPALAMPVGPSRPVTLTMMVLPGYATTPVPQGVIAAAAKQTAQMLQASSNGRVKVRIRMEKPRRIKLPSAAKCQYYNLAGDLVMVQFPQKATNDKMIKTLVFPKSQWCSDATPGGFEHSTTRQPSTVTAWWPDTMADGFEVPPEIQTQLLSLTLTHEYGHVLGLDHSASETCTTNDTVTPWAGRCNVADYGDPFDIMGSGSAFTSLTRSVLIKGKLPSAPPAPKRGQFAVRIDAAGHSNVVQLKSSQGTAYVEYTPQYGAVIRIVGGKPDFGMVTPMIKLVQLSTYSNGTGRFSFAVGDVLAIPGGGSLELLSDDGTTATFATSPVRRPSALLPEITPPTRPDGTSSDYTPDGVAPDGSAPNETAPGATTPEGSASASCAYAQNDPMFGLAQGMSAAEATAILDAQVFTYTTVSTDASGVEQWCTSDANIGLQFTQGLLVGWISP